MTSDESLAEQENQYVAGVSAQVTEHDTLKYHLLGPSLTKAGQDSVDQQKVRFKKSLTVKVCESDGYS